MSYILDESRSHQRFFEEITRIPRKSFHEQAISDYIVNFAKERNLWYRQDTIGNVIIKKKATTGYEDAEPVMLQAHLDMVCEKEPALDFDFLKESIPIYVEGGWVRAKGTSLGADDGAGVALMLAILADDSLKHPEIECVFTVQEEDGMGGALGLDYAPLRAKKLIALDGLQEGTTILSTSGISCGYIVKEISFYPNAKPCFSLKVQGLTGGHAALNIGKDPGNAIKIAARLLHHMSKIASIYLISMQGGTILNGIPQECEVHFASQAPIQKLQASIHTLNLELQEEFKDREPFLEVALTPQDLSPLVMDKTTSEELISLLYLLPIGVQTRSHTIPDLPLASRNMGTISNTEKEVSIGYACRGALKSQISDMAAQAALLAERHGAAYQEKFRYGGYAMNADSPLVRVWESVYKEVTGETLLHTHIHSGTDAGTIHEKMGEMDIIVLMPNTLHVHSPEERMELASFDRTFLYLKKILERLE